MNQNNQTLKNKSSKKEQGILNKEQKNINKEPKIKKILKIKKNAI